MTADSMGHDLTARDPESPRHPTAQPFRPPDVYHEVMARLMEHWSKESKREEAN